MNTKRLLTYVVLAVGGSSLPLRRSAAQATWPNATSTMCGELHRNSDRLSVVLVQRSVHNRRQHPLQADLEILACCPVLE